MQKITPQGVVVTLVNTDPVEPRTVTVQAGAYAESEVTTLMVGNEKAKVDGPNFDVVLAPGAGETLTIHLKRYAYQPTLHFPWEQ